MATDTEICNLALGLLGEFQIASLDESTKQARLCKRFFRFVLDEELRKHTWACAQKRAVLPQLTETPAFGWANQFQLPTDFIRVTEFRHEDGTTSSQNQFEREGNRLLTNFDTVHLIYVARPDDASILDPLAAEVVYTALAIKLAVPLTDDDTIKQNLVREYTGLITPTARYIDSTERDVQPQEESGWIDARSNSTNG